MGLLHILDGKDFTAQPAHPGKSVNRIAVAQGLHGLADQNQGFLDRLAHPAPGGVGHIHQKSAERCCENLCEGGATNNHIRRAVLREFHVCAAAGNGTASRQKMMIRKVGRFMVHLIPILKVHLVANVP
jgi:hypothetical protein